MGKSVFFLSLWINQGLCNEQFFKKADKWHGDTLYYIAMVLVSSTGVTMDMKLEYIKMMPHNIN